jgi:hypothetical protein
MSQFKPGDPRTKTGGRRKGSRDRIETKMLEAIARDFEEHGEEGDPNLPSRTTKRVPEARGLIASQRSRGDYRPECRGDSPD